VVDGDGGVKKMKKTKRWGGLMVVKKKQRNEVREKEQGRRRFVVVGSWALASGYFAAHPTLAETPGQSRPIATTTTTQSYYPLLSINQQELQHLRVK
jgi:hypothetical protein